MAAEAADCVMPSSRAARVMCRRSATATKIRSCSRVMQIPDQSINQIGIIRIIRWIDKSDWRKDFSKCDGFSHDIILGSLHPRQLPWHVGTVQGALPAMDGRGPLPPRKALHARPRAEMC